VSSEKKLAGVVNYKVTPTWILDKLCF